MKLTLVSAGVIGALAFAGTVFAETDASVNVSVGVHGHMMDQDQDGDESWHHATSTGPRMWHATSTAPWTKGPNVIIQGNGEPVVGGTVSAVNGLTITITTAQGGQTYLIDATNAVVDKANATSTVSAISVGDRLIVQGAVSGNNITASGIIDQAPPTASAQASIRVKIMGAIGGFFHHLFGFF